MSGGSVSELSAIVVSYRSREALPGCLEPLRALGAETWVVDNGSDDGSAALVRERFPEVKLIANAENRGFGAACNQALAHATGSVVLFVNPDCVLEPESARALAAHLATNPSSGIVGPRIEDAGGRLAPSAHAFETPLSTLLVLAGARTLLAPALKRLAARLVPAFASYVGNFRATPHRVDWLSGACLAVRASLLRELGGFDEGFFLFMEDEDLCLRAARSGAEVTLVPDALARHAGGASSGEVQIAWPALYRSMLRFQALGHPRGYAIVRAAVLARALASLTLAAGRVALGHEDGRRRLLAWSRVLVLALRSSRERAVRPAVGVWR